MHSFYGHARSRISQEVQKSHPVHSTMEKLNDRTSIDFARSTNHNYQSSEALTQLMEKNRIESRGPWI